LRSALAFAALTTKNGAMEKELYETIIEIPQYESMWLQLLDREDETELVRENFQEFQKLYKPIIDNDFKDLIKISPNG
jgi:hypothetical protein